MAQWRALPTRALAALAAAASVGCASSEPASDAAPAVDIADRDDAAAPPDRSTPEDDGVDASLDAPDAVAADVPVDGGAAAFDGWLFDFPPAMDAARDVAAPDAADAPVDASALRDALASGEGELERLRLTIGVLRGAWCDQVFRCASTPGFSLPRAGLVDRETCRARLDALLDGPDADAVTSASLVSPWLASLRVGGRPALADAVRAGRVRVDDDAALACLRALGATCDAQLSWPAARSNLAWSCGTLGPDDLGSRACQFVLAGAAAVGEGCHVGEECRGDAYCDGTGACPGRCAARTGGPGSDCDRQCPLRSNPGLVCSCGEDAVARCGALRLADPVGEGQACGDVVVGGLLYRARCREGLRCEGYCRPVRPGGAACSPGETFCAEGFVCVDGRCAARVLRDAVGAPCDGPRDACNPFLGLRCGPDGTCLRRARAEGAACSVSFPGGDPCGAGLYCAPTSACRPRSPAGARCVDGAAQCASNRCVDGVCDRPCDLW